VGLVLGAGGVVGQAYHAGVLASMEHDLGWDPRTAEIIVGSSAGSLTGTLLRLGVPASDLASLLVDSPLSLDGADVLDALGQDSMDLPGISFGDVARPWRPPTFRLLARVARRPLAFRPSVAAATLLPKGRIDLMSKAIGLGEVLGDDWPPGLWLCVARRDDGGRVVLGRPGAPKATIVQAVAASCAIPTYFCPVEIEGVSYFDGGVHSPTSADVLRHEGLDLVVVVSPMSSARRLPVVGGAMRWSAHRRLMAEVRRLEARGTTVVRYEPDRRCVATMGLNAMADDRSERVVQQAFLEAGRLRLRADIRAKLAPLATRSQGGVHPA
jgi:NTE family protein